MHNPKMGNGELNLFSDASIQGSYVRHGAAITRSRRGPAMGAWIGWHDCDPTSRPTVAGQAYLGVQGTQRAEYLAAIYSLHSVLAYSRIRQPPATVVLHVDNKTVANVLVGVWEARALSPHNDLAQEVARALADIGATPQVVLVSERHAHHRAAHRMSKSAWNQLFYETSWRPAVRPPDEWHDGSQSSTRSDYS